MITHDDPIPRSQHNRLLLAVHTAMRADAARLLDAVQHLPDGDHHAASELGRAFEVVATLIHEHHWTEDDVMYPFLLGRVPTLEADVLLLEEDHISLDGAMARVGGRFRMLAHTLVPAVRRDVQQHLLDEARELERTLVQHLDREEAVVVPVIDAMPLVEQRTLEHQELELSTYRHMRRAVPWVLANASPVEADRLRRDAPRLLGVLHDHLWARQFARLMAPLYQTPTPD